MNVRFCVDCKSYWANDGTCQRMMKVNLVTGEHYYSMASAQREINLPDYCGYEGKFFVPKLEVVKNGND